MYKNKDMDFWKHVLWSDESKFNLFGIVRTVKHGGSNVKVWRCSEWNGVGNLTFIDGNMTGYMYKDILESNLFQSALKLDLGKISSSSMIMTQSILLILSRIGSANKGLKD